jgi:hypothetical protein
VEDGKKQGMVAMKLPPDIETTEWYLLNTAY